MTDDQFIFTETNIKNINVNYDQNHLDLGELVKLSNDIWNDVKCHHLFNIEEKESEMLRIYFTKYKDFAYGFPIVLKWMICLQQYSQNAFRKYLYKYKEAKITDRTEFVKIQAEYLVFLFKENKHYKIDDINQYRNFVIKQLLEEENLQKQIEQEFTKEINIENEKEDKNKRLEIYEYFKNIHVQT